MEITELRQLWAILSRRRRTQLLWQLVGMIVTSMMEFVAIASIPIFVSVLADPNVALSHPLIQRVTEILGITSTRPFIYLLGFSIIAIFWVKGLATIAIYHGQSSLSAGIASDVTRALFSGYISAPYSYILSRNTAKCINIAASEAIRMVQSYVFPFLQLVLNSFLLFSLIMIILVSDPLLGAGIGFFAGAGGYLFLRVNRSRLAHYGTELSFHSRSLIQKLNEGLGGYKHVKLRGLETEVFNEADYHISQREIAFRSTRFIQLLSKPIFETIGLSALIFMVLVLLMMGRSLDSIVPTLTMLGAVAARALPALFSITGAISNMRANSAAVQNILSEFNELGLKNMTAASTLPPPVRDDQPAGNIELTDVCVRYPGGEHNTLEGLSLTILSGQSVAFVGPTGSGKSTTVDTILGFLDITAGDIRVNGKSIILDMRRWQSKIGYIPQSIYLADTSVRRNVALGEHPDSIQEEDIWRALNDAQLTEYIKSLPEGLDTIVGERGVKLSGGQRQRIGIARALYHNPEVLVLDEATSALDNETEAKVITAIERAKRGRTLIMIAHRLSTVRNCDKIFFLQDGRIVAEGSYDQLSEYNEGFRRMIANEL